MRSDRIRYRIHSPGNIDFYTKHQQKSNILLLGANRKVLGGFSSITATPHAGAIFYSEIVQDCPQVSYFQITFH